MTTLTSDSGMHTVKMEGELRMIHFCKTPAFGRVTSGAIGSKLTVVMVVLRVA